MKLKLLSAAATSTIAAIMVAPLQSASANECIVRDGNNEGRAGARAVDEDGLACGKEALAGTASIAIGSHAQASWNTQVRVDANTAGIAIANALSGSSWLQSNESTAFTANIGYYEGSTALAFSGAQRLNKNFSANVAIGLVPERGDIGARAGVRLGW